MKQDSEEEVIEDTDEEMQEEDNQEEEVLDEPEEGDGSPELKETLKPGRKKKVVNGQRTLPEMSKMQELEIFKALSHKSYKTVGYEFGLQHFFDNDTQVRSAVMNIARKVKRAPELYGISQDVVDVIEEAMASRSLKPGVTKQENALANETFRDKLETMRDKVADMIMKKLNKYDTAKGIDGISIKDLKDLLATAVDKSRLLRGESTENIIRMSKVDTDDMKPEDALKFIMKAREALIEARS